MARLYLDASAGLPLRAEVAALLKAAWDDGQANPSSVHAPGRAARAALDTARAQLREALGFPEADVLFTGSGSEAAALALHGLWQARPHRQRTRVVLSSIEHPCVQLAARALPGATVVEVPCLPDGRVDAQAFLAALGPETALASLMWVNNETGVVQPVPEVARACAAQGIPLHSDAAQAVGRWPLELEGVAVLTLAGHKLGGPTGTGAALVRKGTPLAPLVPGHQEKGLRGGTQSVPLARALALSVELAQRERDAADQALRPVREGLEAALRSRFPSLVVNGASAPRVAGTASLTFPGADAEALLMALDLEGIAVSTGAACASGSLKPSHVLLAMGLSPQAARSTLRVSLPPHTRSEAPGALLEALERALPSSPK